MKHRIVLRIIITAILVAMVMVAVPLALVVSQYGGSIYVDPIEVPHAPVAIVFGAGLRADGKPSTMLSDRVDAAVALYKAGRVERLLMSGDARSIYYDEVTAMQHRAIAGGVPSEAIDLDEAGLSTFDSCYRARTVFGITEAILVSQGYHLPRALYIADSLDIKAVGLKAGSDSYPGQAYFDLREAASLVIAWYEVNVYRRGLNGA
ncbi:MAG: ElyC/SanA/YdcF family protein [Dehalococcoidia bacterium]|nr:ElyC/SanA/YdcF family protein [Dehalococcoidia bacterium]